MFRKIISLALLVFISFSCTAFATEQEETPVSDTPQVSSQSENPSDEIPQTPEPEKSHIIQKGKYYYYRYDNGKIKKTAGFVTDLGKKYYVRKGGKIQTSKSFKRKKKYYRTNKKGVILTGLYKWNKKYNFSNASGQWIKTEGFVKWKDKTYYIKKGGEVVINNGFTVKNHPYRTDITGNVIKLNIPDDNGNAVARVAKKQVGIMTGKTYWRWYYKTKFIDTDRTPWCGAFAAWCYNKAGCYNKILVAKKYGPLGYVPSYSKYASKYHKWVNKKECKGWRYYSVWEKQTCRNRRRYC